MMKRHRLLFVDELGNADGTWYGVQFRAAHEGSRQAKRPAVYFDGAMCVGGPGLFYETTRVELEALS